MIGNGDYGTFEINGTDIILADNSPADYDLDTWLDDLQINSSTLERVTVIYDGHRSGSFIPYLIPPMPPEVPEVKERIVITSTAANGTACFLSDGTISFSNIFWIEVMNGVNTRDAYLRAKQAMIYGCSQQGDQIQVAQIDDNANGISNESSDGLMAYNDTIGTGKSHGGNRPMIDSVTSDNIVLDDGTTSLVIWARDVTNNP